MSDTLYKRKRRDDALHKPFRSPLKQPTTHVDAPQSITPVGGKVDVVIQDCDNTTISKPEGTDAVNHDAPLDTSPTFSAISTASPLASVMRSTPRQTESEYDDMRVMELRIRDLQSDIDTLQQARRILTSDRDEELKQLTRKWRIACRVVIEELFGFAKDKVNRSGGMQAWQEQEDQKQERRREWAIKDQEEEFQRQQEDSESEDDDDEDDTVNPEDAVMRRELKDRRWEARQARKEMREQEREAADPLQPVMEDKGGESKNEEAVMDSKNDGVFTIDMMLKTLNVDVSLVGWDMVEQRWLD